MSVHLRPVQYNRDIAVNKDDPGQDFPRDQRLGLWRHEVDVPRRKVPLVNTIVALLQDALEKPCQNPRRHSLLIWKALGVSLRPGVLTA